MLKSVKLQKGCENAVENCENVEKFRIICGIYFENIT